LFQTDGSSFTRGAVFIPCWAFFTKILIFYIVNNTVSIFKNGIKNVKINVRFIQNMS